MSDLLFIILLIPVSALVAWLLIETAAERYRVLESKVNNIETGLNEVRKDIQIMREEMMDMS